MQKSWKDELVQSLENRLLQGSEDSFFKAEKTAMFKEVNSWGKNASSSLKKCSRKS